MAVPQGSFALRQEATANKGLDPVRFFFQEQTPSFYTNSTLIEKIDVMGSNDHLYITFKFFDDKRQVAESNVSIDNNIASIYLCNGFQAYGMGREIVARTFIRAKQAARSFNLHPKWAAAYYTWGDNDRRREDYYDAQKEPGDPSFQEVTLEHAYRLFEGLNFTLGLREISDIMYKGNSVEGYWARDFEDFCEECEKMLSERYGQANTATGFWKSTLNAHRAILTAA